MKAVWYEQVGPASEVLHYGDMPTPAPAADELLVRLKASGVNPADANRRQGRGYAMEYPRVVPNSDGAGVVEAVGNGVSPNWVGQRVWLYNGQRGRAFGTAAEYIALPEALVMPLPTSTSFIEGACLGIPAMTAYHCVFADGPVQGKTMLITGGAGAVSHYALQFAKWGGAATITTIDTPEKAEHATRAGAALTLNFKTDDVAAGILDFTKGSGVSRIIDVDFGGNLPVSLKVIQDNGVIISYASRGEAAPPLPFYEILRKNLTIRGVLLPGTPEALRRRAQAEVTRWLAEAKPIHTIANTFPLEQTVRAHEAAESGTKLGTIVVTID